MSDLKPCPFCGEAAILERDGDGEVVYEMATCSNPLKCVGKDIYVSKNEWNTRALTEREAKLVGALETAKGAFLTFMAKDKADVGHESYRINVSRISTAAHGDIVATLKSLGIEGEG